MFSLLLCLKKSNPKSNSLSNAHNNVICNDALFITMTFLTPNEIIILSRVCLAWSKLTNEDMAWKSSAIRYLNHKNQFSEKKFNEIKSIRNALKVSFEVSKFQKQFITNQAKIKKEEDHLLDEKNIPTYIHSNNSHYTPTYCVHPLNTSPVFYYVSEYFKKKNTISKIRKITQENEKLSIQIQELEPFSLESKMKI